MGGDGRRAQRKPTWLFFLRCLFFPTKKNGFSDCQWIPYLYHDSYSTPLCKWPLHAPSPFLLPAWCCTCVLLACFCSCLCCGKFVRHGLNLSHQELGWNSNRQFAGMNIWIPCRESTCFYLSDSTKKWSELNPPTICMNHSNSRNQDLIVIYSDYSDLS